MEPGNEETRSKRTRRATAVSSLIFDPRNYAPEDQELLLRYLGKGSKNKSVKIQVPTSNSDDPVVQGDSQSSVSAQPKVTNSLSLNEKGLRSQEKGAPQASKHTISKQIAAIKPDDSISHHPAVLDSNLSSKTISSNVSTPFPEPDKKNQKRVQKEKAVVESIEAKRDNIKSNTTNFTSVKEAPHASVYTSGEYEPSYFIERILGCRSMTVQEWSRFLSQPHFQTHELNRGSVWMISDRYVIPAGTLTLRRMNTVMKI